MYLSETKYDLKKTFPLKLVVMFILFTLGIILVGFYYYRDQRKRIFLEQENDLGAIASLKLSQIEQWREEMLKDAEILKNNELLVNVIKESFDDRDMAIQYENILKWLESVCKEFDGTGASLVDTSLNVLFSVSQTDSITGKYITEDLVTVLSDKKVHLTELHQTGIKKGDVIDLLIPLSDFRREDQRLFCIIIVRIELRKTLFPIIESWPATSTSSETQVVCKEGDSVLYLNNLRHQQNTSSNLKLPLSNEQLLASKAVGGIDGIVEGVDYRNIPVVGYITRIPGLPWYMVAKINKEELQAPLRRVLYFVIIVVILLGLLIAFTHVLWMREKEVRSIARDNAALRRAEEEIRRLNAELEHRVTERTEQLEASNKELEAFCYSVSHDLRSPLRSIHGYTTLLIEEYKENLDDEGKRLCGVITSSAAQMGELIDDLLGFSRIGKCNINSVLLEMDSLAAIVFEDITSKKEKAEITLEIGKLHKTYGDLSLMRLVWNNLISNAIKYSSKVSSPLISIGSEQEDGMINYYVKDNGVGFDMRYKHKLFGVFQRLHGEKEFEGNGVGLAIVNRIIARHNGKVWAEGEVGKGAAFYFSLPANMKDKSEMIK
jgi:signal transduction histidine kinase